jgi:arylsulfatase A-like enzyme
MKRRDFLKAAGAGALSVPCVSRLAHAGGEGPNVLFIAVDDLNDWTGCLGGHPDARTPNIDRLAARGVLFTNAHCAAPLCNPSRAALMTGIRPSTSGVYLNPQPWRGSPALKDAVTLPQHFMAHGYRAAGSGKIYHGAYPDPASWHEYWPSKRKTRPSECYTKERASLSGLNAAHFDWGPIALPEGGKMSDSLVADWVSGRISKRRDRPFFLACGIFRPHLPWYVPRKYFDMFPLESVALPVVKEDDLDDIPPVGRRFARPQGDHAKVLRHGQWRRAVQGYLASISFADECVGSVIDALDASPHARDTVVVLWADHGWHLGEKLHWRKFTLWEEATRNPLLFVAPGVARGRCSRPVSLLDVYPTLVEFCGLPPREGLEGKSLVPLLRDPGAHWDTPAVTTYKRGNHSVRSERWRYTRYSDGTEELYDHLEDPLEWENLAERPGCEGVKGALARWLPEADAPGVPIERRRRWKGR